MAASVTHPRHVKNPGKPSSGGRRDEWHGERPWPAFPPPAGKSWSECLGHEKRTFSLAVLRHEAVLVLAGATAVVVLAVLLAPFVIRTIGAVGLLPAVFLLVVYIGFLTIPVWLAAILDDVEDHGDEIEARAGGGPRDAERP